MSAQARKVRPIAFDGAEWATADPEGKTGPLMGRDALQLRTGEIWRRDVEFADGTIEFEMAPQPKRSLPRCDAPPVGGEAAALLIRTSISARRHRASGKRCVRNRCSRELGAGNCATGRV